MKISQKISLLLMVWLYVTSISCERLTNDLPSADFSVSPLIGDLETIFLFDASGVEDEETTFWRLKVRWDAGSDGTWDSEYSVEKKFGYRFSSEGEHKVTLEVLDSYGGISQLEKTVFVTPVVLDSMMTDLRDNQEYRIVRIWDVWYMAENMRYGKIISKNQFPADDDQVEAWYFSFNSKMADKYGYFYTRNEATEYKSNEEQGICPDGWHIFSYEEFMELKSILRKVDVKSDFIGVEGEFHLELALAGRYYFPGGEWEGQGSHASFWLNRELPFTRYNAWAFFNDTVFEEQSELYNVSWQLDWNKDWGEFSYNKIALPVRCVKDQ